MKKLTSMPSTSPEQFMHTDFSICSPSTHPKHSINRIVEYLKNILKIRVHLNFRDVEHLYNDGAQFYNNFFGAQSPEELWQKVNEKKSETIEERQIIGFLVKIVIILTKQKNECAKNKKYKQFAELKQTIELLQDRIIKIQEIIRQKIKERLLKQQIAEKTSRKRSLQRNLNEQTGFIMANSQYLNQQTTQRHFKQLDMHKKFIEKTSKDVEHLYLPTKTLRQAKEKSLLAKLAPFKSEKKRPYECRSLSRDLDAIVKTGTLQVNDNIEKYKRIEREKIKRRQNIERDHILTKIQNENNVSFWKMSLEKEKLQKEENIKIQKLIQQTNKQKKQRVNSLQKSLRAYSMRDQTKQIKGITKNHHESIQFLTNIKQVGNITYHDQIKQPKYTTLDLSSFNKNRYDDDDYLEKKILRSINNHQQSNLENHRKSLVDLYDRELRQL